MAARTKLTQTLYGLSERTGAVSQMEMNMSKIIQAVYLGTCDSGCCVR